MAVINLRISSVCLKAVGAEQPRLNEIRMINIFDYTVTPEDLSSSSIPSASL
jgi:hypothetical protein